jgi:hypothetical protein
MNKLCALALSALTLFSTLPTSVLAVGASAAVLGTSGCTTTAAQMAADGKAAGEAALQVALLIEDPAKAADVTMAANGLISATSNWQSGSTTAYINDAAGVLEIALAAIPQTAIIAPLIPLAVALLDTIIANTTQAASAGAMKALAPNPYRSKAAIHHRFLRSQEGDFKAAWNAVVSAHPELAKAKL